MRKPRIEDVLILLLFIFFFHWLALNYHYYWSIWWYDLPMHFLGGFWIVLALNWLGRKLSFSLNLTQIILAVLAVGLAWELYELAFGLTFTENPQYLSDTLTDLMMDIAGALGARYVLSPKAPTPRSER